MTFQTGSESPSPALAALSNRGVLELSGTDRVSFLQGLVSNDVEQAAPGHAVWAALLTPQGKYLTDFFIFSSDEILLLDCERAAIPLLLARLPRFRLRAQVTIAARDGWTVYAGWNAAAPPGIAAPDPRLATAGFRLLSSDPLPVTATQADYDRHRLTLGLPDGARDLEPEKTTLLEAGFDELSGISWTKGCYMGQELTARTKYRGLLKRRLVPVTLDGPLPAPGTPVLHNGAEIGTMRSGLDHRGLAILRLDALDASLRCGESTLRPDIPAWMKLPEKIPSPAST